MKEPYRVSLKHLNTFMISHVWFVTLRFNKYMKCKECYLKKKEKEVTFMFASDHILSIILLVIFFSFKHYVHLWSSEIETMLSFELNDLVKTSNHDFSGSCCDLVKLQLNFQSVKYFKRDGALPHETPSKVWFTQRELQTLRNCRHSSLNPGSDVLQNVWDVAAK